MWSHCITHSDPVAGLKLITSYALTGKDAGAKGLHVSEYSICGVLGQVCGLGLSCPPALVSVLLSTLVAVSSASCLPDLQGYAGSLHPHSSASLVFPKEGKPML